MDEEPMQRWRDEWDYRDHLLRVVERTDRKVNDLRRKVEEMAIAQEQFDTDMAALKQAIMDLTAAVDAWMAAHPDADFTAEDQAVQDASAAVKAELDKLNPQPAPGPTGPTG